MSALQLPFAGRVVPASALPLAPGSSPRWDLASLAGRLVELSASTQAAHLTAAFGLVLEAQLAEDTAVWITLESSSFFPPDVLEGGIDLEALTVVRVPDVRIAGRAAGHLVQSGGFGLVAIDLSSGSEIAAGNIRPTHPLPVPLLTRLLGLARRQNTAVLLLTKKSGEDPSLHSLISLRAEAQWRRQEGRYEVSIRVLKDKRDGRRWRHVEMCRGPAGLR